MRDNKAIAAIAIITALGATAFIYVTGHGGFGPGINSRIPEAAGYTLAQQALTLLKPGGQIIIIARDTKTFKNPASDILLQSFQNTVRRARGVIGPLQLLEV